MNARRWLIGAVTAGMIVVAGILVVRELTAPSALPPVVRAVGWFYSAMPSRLASGAMVVPWISTERATTMKTRP